MAAQNFRSEEGSGSVLTALVALALVLLVSTIGAVFDTYRIRQTLQHAADASALAAADTLMGVATGFPCERAAEVAATYGVELDECECTSETECQTGVSRWAIIGVLTEHARAGPH